MIEERVEVKEGDILVIHTGYHHFGWDMPTADEIRYMVKHPGPDREFAVWAQGRNCAGSPWTAALPTTR